MKRILNKTSKMLEIEQLNGKEIEEIVRQLYVDENKTLNEICTELSISLITAMKWLNLAGVYSRKLDLE